MVKLHCFGLQHFGEREGLSEQRALGCFRFHVNLVAPRVCFRVEGTFVAQANVLRKSGCTSFSAERKAPLGLRQRVYAILIPPPVLPRA